MDMISGGAAKAEETFRATSGAVRICILEDHEPLRESLTDALIESGYIVEGFESAEALAESAFLFSAHVFVTDLNLPGEDGISVVQRIKRLLPELKIIMMTARTAVDDRVTGYDSGADIYLPKPIALQELVATIRAVTRELSGSKPQEIEGTLCSRSSLLEGPTGRARLTQMEVQILSALAGAYEQKLEHWQLLELLALDVDDAGKARLAVRMTRLRHRLQKIGLSPDALHAVRGEGYKLTIRLKMEGGALPA